MDENNDAMPWKTWGIIGAALLAAGIAAGITISCYNRRPDRRAKRLVDKSRHLIDTISEALEEFEQTTSNTGA
ncbi:MAG: hypothetical protein ACLFWB_04735 [Armatimonadota bacterium]